MTVERASKLWLLTTLVLILMILASSLIIWFQRGRSQPLVVYPPQPAVIQGEIYVYGAVAHPRLFTLDDKETISSLVQASGGTHPDADLSRVHLYIPSLRELQEPQKINLNRAEVWLLKALPEIGEIRAREILEYRQKNGPFQSTQEITSVTGISPAIYEKIKDLITVAD